MNNVYICIFVFKNKEQHIDMGIQAFFFIEQGI